jgi:uncharacterized protein (TIGR03083 family)
MNGLDFEQSIARESEAFAAVVDAGSLDRRVPGCPDWTLRDLTWHLGNVQRFWADMVRAGTDTQPEFFEGSTGPSEVAELAAWMRASTRDLLGALHDTPYDAPAWAWWRDDHTVGAVARHQVQEAAVHRWDAQSVIGSPEPVPQPEADDAVDEFAWIRRQTDDQAPIVLVATDSGVSFPLSDSKPAVTVSAPASDLLLVLYGRVKPEEVSVEGDRSTLDQFLQPFE